MVKMPELPELTFDEGPHLYRLHGLAILSVTTLMKPLTADVYGGVDEWVMERAAERGTAVHNSIENWVSYGIKILPRSIGGYFDGFLAWVKDFKPEILGTECRLYHKALRYAGDSRPSLRCWRKADHGGPEDHSPAPRNACQGPAGGLCEGV